MIVGGLTNPARSCRRCCRAAPDLRGHIDGVAIHPYGPTRRACCERRPRAPRCWPLGLGDVPLYITELGWTTQPAERPNYLPEQRRPAYIERTLAALGHVDCGLAATIVYTWVTPERNPADGEDWFGIHPPGGGGSADSAAFAAGLRARAAPPATQARGDRQLVSDG